MTHTETIRAILAFYRFDVPLSSGDRLHAIKSKKKVLVSILKKYGKYTLIVMLCTNLVFLCKKAGIYITITKALVILVTGTVLFLLLSSLILAYILYTPDKAAMDDVIASAPIVETAVPKPAVNQQKLAEPVINYKIQITDFTSMPADKKITARFVGTLKRSISKNGGKEAVAYLRDTKNYQAPTVLTGAVLKTDEGFIVTVRLVDSSSSQVKSLVREKAATAADLDLLAKKIAQEIVKGL